MKSPLPLCKFKVRTFGLLDGPVRQPLALSDGGRQMRLARLGRFLKPRERLGDDRPKQCRAQRRTRRSSSETYKCRYVAEDQSPEWVHQGDSQREVKIGQPIYEAHGQRGGSSYAVRECFNRLHHVQSVRLLQCPQWVDSGRHR